MREKFKQIGPLDKFMRFLFMRSSALCIVTYVAIKIYVVQNLCDQRLTHINLMQKFVPLGY